MNLFRSKKKIEEDFKNYLKNLILGRPINNKSFQKFFLNKKLIIADVGSTGGLSFLWNKINNYILCYSFDPDIRAEEKLDENIQNHPTALWSSNTQKNLYLTKFPDASSIYEPNQKLLDLFLNADSHHVEKKILINTKTIDGICKKKELPDFIKVDAEGADLEILKGAKTSLSKSCIGIQIEVQFIERNIGSPLFSEVDSFLRNAGYWIMDLKKESWIRDNSFYKVTSKPQLIWGDAVYMLTSDEVLKRGYVLSKKERNFFLAKLIMISLIYGFHDYSFQIINLFYKNKLITKNEKDAFNILLNENIKSNLNVIMIKLIIVLLSTIALFLFFLFSKTRNQAFRIWKASIIGLMSAFTNFLSRTGLNRESVGDTSF